jgi:hypothetical protein
VPYKRDRRGSEAIITPQASVLTTYLAPPKSRQISTNGLRLHLILLVRDRRGCRTYGRDVLTLLAQVVRNHGHKLRLLQGLLQLLRLCQRCQDRGSSPS